ncbi:murein DD-endopeptidase MepM/ murein hydrolase activator NlpD [Halanaerobium sp. DL-01]|uniref:peptidoglycan DD-metalloendopeptidase family protein n=1 Tax=Halanaerobium sp. DL-01 TaxID=1653064 RepID=UPI000DF18DE9|nr:M23 family metallopeptidase [Halanaerobium sp. DL-01]RCW80750.1 murein DD-endopeptidase MepM/ murein hydrolase activator NlpD [Halanaerobium sp. DL-01]
MKKGQRLIVFLIIFLTMGLSAYTNSMAFNNYYGGRYPLENRNNDSSTNRAERPQIKKDNRPVEQDKNIDKKNYTENDNDFINTDKAFTKPPEIESDLGDDLKKMDREKNINLSPERPEIGEKEKVFKTSGKPDLIDKMKIHTVKRGETLWDIAHKYNINIDTLIGANDIANMNSIKPGQELKILPVKGILYRVSPGESMSEVASKFNISLKKIIEDNNIENPNRVEIDKLLVLRGAVPEFSYRDRLEKKFIKPINTRITSYYGMRWGRMHEGIDFAAPMGTPIKAVSSGRVVYSGWATGYGYCVIIEHQKGLRTLYAHNSKLLVRVGERVGRGEIISKSGNTGNSTGPHLHFEVQVNGRPANPLNYLN